jgi:hypothetical protein
MGALDGCGCASVGAGWLLAAKGWIVRPLESIAETQPQLQPRFSKKADHPPRADLGIKKPERPTSCARDPAQRKICIKKRK